MKKKAYSITLIFIFSCIFNATTLLSLDDKFVLKKTGHRKPPIMFTHKAHSEDYGAKCIDCHHKGKNIKCSKCHFVRDQGNVINIKGAYHQQCHDCHRRTSGPKACGRCHKVAKK